MALIPYVGGSLDIILSHRFQEIAKRRIEFMLAALATRLKDVTEDKIDLAFLESEDWADIVRLAIERSARIRNKERLAAVAEILKGVATREVCATGHAEDLLEVIASLNDEETVVLREVHRESVDGRGEITGYGKSLEGRIPQQLFNRIPFLLKRLEALGLISEVTGTFYGYGGGSYSLTTVGKEICDYLLGDDRRDDQSIGSVSGS